jgi:hypothetical protein
VDGVTRSDEAPVVRTFLDSLPYVIQWDQVARSHAHSAALRNGLLDVVREMAKQHNRLPALDAAIVGARAAPISYSGLTAAEVGDARDAITEAAMALAVRDLISLEQFWAVYRPFAALIPLDLPPTWGRGYRPLPAR